jgi:hypothetical protein
VEWTVHVDHDLAHWMTHALWRALFSCQDCGADVVRLVRSNPDELVRCFGCEASHAHRISDRLLQLALHDVAS